MSKRSADAADLDPAHVPEWQPASGESPQEREKRLKREKRAAKLGVSVETLVADPTASHPLPAASASASGPAPAASSTGPGGEWQPAAGESPAEREKRIKREKRAARLGLPVEQLQADSRAAPAGPARAPLEAQESQFTAYDPNAERGQGISVHPSRLGVATLAREEVKKEPKEKTVARKRYLKAKLVRAKGRKAGAPKNQSQQDRSRAGSSVPAGSQVDGEGDGDDDEAEGEGEEEGDGDATAARPNADLSPEELALKQAVITEKKAQRKAQRDAKKAEIRALKAAGAPVPAPAKRVIAPRAAPAVVAPVTKVKALPEPVAEPTEAELKAKAEAEKEAADLAARKEAKRLKRTTRRMSPQPEDEAEAREVADEEQEDEEMKDASEDEVEEKERSALLRLPGATRPAPPSAATLSALKVHESVRDKQVVDPELRLPLNQLGLSPRGVDRLADMGFTQAFAVQTAVLPLLLPASAPTFLYSPFNPPQDVCVSAPTGSGKTLSYVVPIIETLAPRIVTRLRALVLLPTRDLVAQVRETFDGFAKGTGLKVGIATGQHSFAQEQALLVAGAASSAQGGSSLVDVLIATPGRLMDHIRQTAGFSLQHLRYLVIDEADRLLTQSFHDWLPSILAALKPSPAAAQAALVGPATSDALAPEAWDAGIGRVGSDLDERLQSSCQKLLFSATLSRDPAKIAALRLHRPVYVSVEDALDPHAEDEGVDGELKFTFPASLSESMIFTPPSHKPLHLFYLLHTVGVKAALCFTKSVEAATRLAKLVEFFEDARCAKDPAATRAVVRAYSSELPNAERTRLLASFKKGEVQMLICSDLISRGIDLPDVSHVLSYDIPADMRKYVHRVGRTARAGKEGAAWSLVEDPEAAPFRAMMKGAGHWDKVKRVRVKDHEVEGFVEGYQVALARLKKYFAVGREDEA